MAYEPEMVLIPAGRFTMGSNENDDSTPTRRVSVRAFELGKYEVTQGQWKAVMGSNPSRFDQCGDDCPVESVSWEDVQVYLRKLNEKLGLSGKVAYRLPSEAEWEYAARAGTKTSYWWGNTASRDHANYGEDSCCNGHAEGKDRWVNTAPVGQFPPNAFGLHDMHGNVSEWVQDLWHADYSGAPTDGSAWEEVHGYSARVQRGGSWFFHPQFLRSDVRVRASTGERGFGDGIRLARTVP